MGSERQQRYSLPWRILPWLRSSGDCNNHQDTPPSFQRRTQDSAIARGVGPAAHHPGEDAVRRRRTGVGPDQYRLRPGLDDHRSVPVGLSVGALPHHQGGGEDAHAAIDLRGNIPSFIHISDGKLHDVHALDMLLPEAGAIYVVDRGYVDFAAFMCCTKPGPSSSRVPSRTSMLIASIRRRRIARPASFATRPSPWTASWLLAGP